jgi:hypothetical protein
MEPSRMTRDDSGRRNVDRMHCRERRRVDSKQRRGRHGEVEG